MCATIDGKIEDSAGPFFEANLCDYNGDGIKEKPFEILYIGGIEPTTENIASLTKTPSTVSSTVDGVAISETLVSTSIRESKQVRRSVYADPITSKENQFLQKDSMLKFDSTVNIQGIPPFSKPLLVDLELTGFDPTNRNFFIPIDLADSTQFTLANTDNFIQNG